MSVCEGNTAAGLQATPALDDSSASTGALEPPDSGHSLAKTLDSLRLSDAVQNNKSNLHTVESTLGNGVLSAPIQCHRPGDKQPQHGAYAIPGHGGSSYGSRFTRHPTLHAPASMESHSSFDTFSSVPPSPSMSEGLTDSPSSVSSFSSYRRGDLADIEDLDLEPELETVSECDEESSSLCSTDVVGDMDSDSERASIAGLDNDHSSLGLGASASLGRTGTLKALASGSPAADYARRKRSEWYLNSYANKIASRRPRKPKVSRVAEIVEEGGGDIRTTVMPRPPFASSAGEWTCEVVGPPAPAPRSVSPSDTVPSVPSPLCVCISSEASPTSATAGAAGMDDSVETVKALQGGADGDEARSKTSQDPKMATEEPSEDTAAPPPSSSPPRTSRPRRDSSPPRLRPCFRRRTSNQSAASTRESSCERESVRGRSVRFSPAPPIEMRTHSPVEYDRKSCPVNNRLSPEDVEELRTMKMEMGLLEAKWAADAACKAPVREHAAEHLSGEVSDAARNAGVAALSATAPRTPVGPSDGAHMTTAARIRLQKEREREKERQKQMPRNRALLASSARPQYDCDSVRAKFGQAPPPPLPGLPQPAARSASPRSSSAPPISRTPSEERAFRSHLTQPSALSDRRSSVIPTVTQTAPSPPSSPMDVDAAIQSSIDWNRDRIGADSLTPPGSHSPQKARGRTPGPATLPSATSVRYSSPSPSSSSSSSLRPANMPASWTPPSIESKPPPPSFPGSGPMGGYDSPASCDFYESGSEYDLIG